MPRMREKDRTKEQLIKEVADLRRRIVELERAETERKQAEGALRESEEGLEAIFNEVRDGIVLLDLTGKIIKINKRITEATGYTEKYIIGKRFNFFKNFTSTSIAKMIFNFSKAVASQQVSPFEVEGYTKTGEKRIGEIYGSLLRKKGKAAGVLVVMTDITERKQAEEALRESERRYRTLVDNIDLAINLIDADRNIVMVNAVHSRDFKRPISEVIGKKCFREFEKRDAVCPHCPGSQTIVTGQPAEAETEGVRDDGSRFQVRLQTFPIFGQDGKVTAFIEVAEDISERKRMEEALRESEKKYRTILETMEDGYFEVDLRGNLTFFNEALCRIHGRSPDEMISLDNRQFTSPETAKRIYAIFNKVYRTGIPATIVDYEIMRKDGSMAMIEESASLLRNAAGEPIGFYGVSRDRTEQKRAEEALRQSEEKYRTILEDIEEGYYEVDLAGNFTFFNDSLCKIQGYTRDELMGMNNREYMDKETVKRVYKIFNTVFRTGKGAKIHDWHIIRKDGSKRAVEASVSLIRDAEGKKTGFRGVIRDITERKRAEEELQYTATHDALTGLPNRALFNDRLSLALTQADRNKKKLAVMLLDLDYFKDVNDTMGHSMGDQLLRVVGNRLTELLRKGDTVARVGGDEFLLLLSEIARIKDANIIAQKILETFRKPFVLDDHEIMITTSIGIAIYPDDGADAHTLMKHADVAMYRAKDKGRDNFQRYTPA